MNRREPEAVDLEVHGGRYIAWDRSRRRIVASGSDFRDARERAREAGHPIAFLEYIPTAEEMRRGIRW